MSTSWTPQLKRAMRVCRLFGPVVCAFLTAAPDASARPLVVFTVDVESNETVRLPDQIDTVCQDGSRCGLFEIVRLLRARGWSGTFFLNVYEHRAWGEQTMRDIAARLQNNAQDVALHTHPHWAYDRRRPSMYQYSLNDQMTIVRDGVRLLETWTGRPVVAHRAGGYTADERTLVALSRNGIVVDSSRLWRNPGSHLEALGLSRNVPSRYGRILEIPVTVYERNDRPAAFTNSLAPVTSIRKIDPNWFVDADEARRAIAESVAADLPVIVVFLHSFSFMAGAANGGAPLADRHAMELFRIIADEVSKRGLHVVTMRDLAENRAALPDALRDAVPTVTIRVGLTTYLWRRVKHAEAAPPVTAGVVLLLGAATLLVLRSRRRSKDQPTVTPRRAAAGVTTGVGRP